jgi:NADH:ubiquinone oxidoreductase subunit 6 (subunit J)
MLKIFFICLIVSIAVLICCSSNVIFSIFSFIGIIINIVGLLLSFNIEFLSLIFLIIYIGAIIVLFLFVIFIINLDNFYYYTKNYDDSIYKSLNFDLKYFFILFCSFISIKFFLNLYTYTIQFQFSELFVLEKLEYFYLNNIILFFEFNDIDLIGLLLYGKYSTLIIISSIILLIAIIGSVILVTQNKK